MTSDRSLVVQRLNMRSNEEVKLHVSELGDGKEDSWTTFEASLQQHPDPTYVQISLQDVQLTGVGPQHSAIYALTVELQQESQSKVNPYLQKVTKNTLKQMI